VSPLSADQSLAVDESLAVDATPAGGVASWRSQTGIEVHGVDRYMRVCRSCGGTFRAEHHLAGYCSSGCRASVRAAQVREAKSRWVERSRNAFPVEGAAQDRGISNGDGRPSPDPGSAAPVAAPSTGNQKGGSVDSGAECPICEHATEHGAWPHDVLRAGRTHCRGCHRTWLGKTRAGHCGKCHRHFSSQGGFKAHQTINRERGTVECADPATINKPMVADENGIWRWPADPDRVWPR
jgi:hypothetical protein